RYLSVGSAMGLMLLMLGGVSESVAQSESGDAPTARLEAPAETLQFNFQDAPLDTVLDYLSRAAGFTVIREASVSGRVNVVSHQTLTPDEALDLLNTILYQQGYAAIRSGRTLTIVGREEALRRNIPVRRGNDP